MLMRDLMTEVSHQAYSLRLAIPVRDPMTEVNYTNERSDD